LNGSISTVRVLRPDRLFHNLRSRRPQISEPDPAEISGVLAEYDFESTNEYQTVAGGNRSYSLLVHTTTGKRLLKKYKDSLAEATIIQEHSILTYLAQVDFPAPRLAPTRLGRTLVLNNGSRYALFDFIEDGFQYQNYILWPGQTRRCITIAGETLGTLHQALKTFEPQGYNPDGFKSQNEDRWRSLSWFLDRLAHCVAETSRLNTGTRKSQAAWLLSQAGYLEESLVQLDTMLKEAPLPRLIIHADYGPYNLLFRRNGPAVVLDFEMARLDWRITDFIRACYRFCYNKLGYRLTKMKWFLEGYQSHELLTENEWHYMPLVWKFLHIRQCILNWHYYCETLAESSLVTAHHNLKLAEWMVANRDNLRPI
jgi:Ser/Thr protein kinase RdoA (MazF antagonist)